MVLDAYLAVFLKKLVFNKYYVIMFLLFWTERLFLLIVTEKDQQQTAV